MSEVSEAIQAKCLAFGDRVIKLNDYLLSQAAMEHENYKKSKIQKKGKQTSSFLHQTSDISVAHHPSSIKHQTSSDYEQYKIQQYVYSKC